MRESIPSWLCELLGGREPDELEPEQREAIWAVLTEFGPDTVEARGRIASILGDWDLEPGIHEWERVARNRRFLDETATVDDYREFVRAQRARETGGESNDE